MALLKPAHGEESTPWHQDAAFGDPRYDSEAVSFWLPLQEATIANGCLHFIPQPPRGGPASSTGQGRPAAARTGVRRRIRSDRGRRLPLSGRRCLTPRWDDIALGGPQPLGSTSLRLCPHFRHTGTTANHPPTIPLARAEQHGQAKTRAAVDREDGSDGGVGAVARLQDPEAHLQVPRPPPGDHRRIDPGLIASEGKGRYRAERRPRGITGRSQTVPRWSRTVSIRTRSGRAPGHPAWSTSSMARSSWRPCQVS